MLCSGFPSRETGRRIVTVTDLTGEYGSKANPCVYAVERRMICKIRRAALFTDDDMGSRVGLTWS